MSAAERFLEETRQRQALLKPRLVTRLIDEDYYSSDSDDYDYDGDDLPADGQPESNLGSQAESARGRSRTGSSDRQMGFGAILEFSEDESEDGD